MMHAHTHTHCHVLYTLYHLHTIYSILPTIYTSIQQSLPPVEHQVPMRQLPPSLFTLQPRTLPTNVYMRYGYDQDHGPKQPIPAL